MPSRAGQPRRQVWLSAATGELCDRVAGLMSAAAGRPVPLTEAIKTALEAYEPTAAAAARKEVNR